MGEWLRVVGGVSIQLHVHNVLDDQRMHSHGVCVPLVGVVQLPACSCCVLGPVVLTPCRGTCIPYMVFIQ